LTLPALPYWYKKRKVIQKNQSFLLSTDEQENCFKRSTKIYIKIAIAAACFGVITIIRERTV